VSKVTQRLRPQDFVFTLMGDYLLHRPGEVWVGSLIQLLGGLGWTPAATRTVLSRMTRKGWLRASGNGRRGWYGLSEQGRALLQEGEARIYHPPRGQAWDGWWQLVAYSIPEQQRSQRDRLRLRLQWLGFGQLGNGLWISPHALQGEIKALAGALRVSGHIEVFRAQHLGFSSVEELVGFCWDLAAINRRYRAFLTRHEAGYARACDLVMKQRLSAQDAFVRRFRLVHAYRVFPLLDPYLPDGLLPAGWQGYAAAELFERYHDLLAEPAESCVSEALAMSEEKLTG
jgi:phenylacetic acid degradation operon negative regulatory protein